LNDVRLVSSSASTVCNTFSSENFWLKHKHKTPRCIFVVAYTDSIIKRIMFKNSCQLFIVCCGWLVSPLSLILNLHTHTTLYRYIMLFCSAIIWTRCSRHWTAAVVCTQKKSKSLLETRSSFDSSLIHLLSSWLVIALVTLLSFVCKRCSLAFLIEPNQKRLIIWNSI